MRIHPTAIIAKNAKIDESVSVGAYSVIGDSVVIKKGTKISEHVVISGDTLIGENNEIFPFASIGQAPQDLKYDGENTKLIIGNNNKIREFVTINKGTIASGKTVIGDNNLFMAYVHIAHDCIVGNNCIFANAATLGGHAEIDDYVVIGGLSGVHQFVKIGANVMIGATSAIVKDVLPYVTIKGSENPKIRGLNLIGLKRRGISNEDIKSIKEAYKMIYMGKKTLKDLLVELEEKYEGNEYIKYLINFARKSERGIYR
ncbi:acyl-ACP--UDP-N-acetylglucosamine O-acyltransferase [Haliovirga abyssi]|uniref:Acyl-[acyl-carrier-protein]--UDP-N-acetylglucosamine O-acyltransferase n=1 Tax=Haliovirga abyssi TaxID=2996794 RepID=A0AAU9D2W4_9FUSO|nr:acyl-ACP--UDP-N-acetylglucosamine O-acyltransferase [Haliovirga abyssi]BDU50344.1 acyl-[acyl-carrier-protein]--UDP-N-acetylglucosamine O-acyltransferase [Haliovirga abyssi]